MSEVSICNLALAYLGEDGIRSLDEVNKRAGMCKTFYPIVRDSILSGYDWSFARKTALLQQLDVEHIEGAVYQIPTDCLTPLSLYPRPQTRAYWKVEGDTIILPWIEQGDTSIDIYLQYTKRETNTSIFSSSFVDIVALEMAVRMGHSLTQDIKLVASLKQELRVLRMENEAEDANRGDEYRFADEDPENDTFVNPLEG